MRSSSLKGVIYLSLSACWVSPWARRQITISPELFKTSIRLAIFLASRSSCKWISELKTKEKRILFVLKAVEGQAGRNAGRPLQNTADSEHDANLIAVDSESRTLNFTERGHGHVNTSYFIGCDCLSGLTPHLFTLRPHPPLVSSVYLPFSFFSCIYILLASHTAVGYRMQTKIKRKVCGWRSLFGLRSESRLLLNRKSRPRQNQHNPVSGQSALNTTDDPYHDLQSSPSYEYCRFVEAYVSRRFVIIRVQQADPGLLVCLRRRTVVSWWPSITLRRDDLRVVGSR